MLGNSHSGRASSRPAVATAAPGCSAGLRLLLLLALPAAGGGGGVGGGAGGGGVLLAGVEQALPAAVGQLLRAHTAVVRGAAWKIFQCQKIFQYQVKCVVCGW